MVGDLRLWLAGLGVVGAGSIYALADPLPDGVYREPMAQAYASLAKANFQFREGDIASKATVSHEGNGTNKIFLTFSKETSSQECTILLSPYKNRGDATTMDVTCDSGGAAPGMDSAPTELFANSVAESADAALTGKPLRPLKEQLFEAAAGGGGSFNRVARDAAVMRHSINRELTQMRQDQAESDTSDESSGWADDSWTHDDTSPTM